jgi:transcription initiation factor TFIIH subunit 1
MPGGFVNVDENETQYSGVQYKKMMGQLTLNYSEGMTFRCNTTGETVVFAWHNIVKHMVSPVKSGKHLLKLILNEGKESAKFEFTERDPLENVRKDISRQLKALRTVTTVSFESLSGKKRGASEMNGSPNGGEANSFEDLEPTALAVARSAVLAAHAKLRQQHQYLVEESKTVTEDDFWKTHENLLAEEYARMAGLTKAGGSSILQSHVPASGRVTLAVEEMRQIFILYPAVHKAYEEKVPLEMSDEQFWRKYLESEYFHRDRGRMGTAARIHAGGNTSNGDANKKSKGSGLSTEEQDARAAAAGADDLFSRYEQKLQEAKANEGSQSNRRQWGTKLGVGQFDLAKTFETERGNLLAGPQDNHPQLSDGKGTRVVEKYNRHWAMVLHPDEAVAGADLLAIARKSAMEAPDDDEDATPGGGVNEEMVRLVEFASSNPDEVDHAHAQGIDEAEYEPLTLRNIEAYNYAQTQTQTMGSTTTANDSEQQQQHEQHLVYAKVMVQKTKEMVNKISSQGPEGFFLPDSCFPPSGYGFKVMESLTMKMENDSKTEEESLEMLKRLPEDFKETLQSYFRRSSELLRHFFGLRRLEEQSGRSSSSPKLARIVEAMQSFYREMEQMRKNLPDGIQGGEMRQMVDPIMRQLNWIFQQHIGSRRGSGGFVDVEN